VATDEPKSGRARATSSTRPRTSRRAADRTSARPLFAADAGPEEAAVPAPAVGPPDRPQDALDHPERPDLRGQTVWVVDTLSRVYQLFHALPEMTSPRGEPVSAVFGLARDLLDIGQKRAPDYLLAALDAPGGTFRHDASPDYKATRAEMPADLVPQIDLVRRLFALLGIPLLEVPGVEADDVLATVAAQATALGADCVLATSDKDARQLLGEHVRLLNLRTGRMFDAAELEAEWGIRPEQVVDFLSLVGDSVDNVPGVPLIGPKVAGELLRRFGTLDEVLARADEAPGRKRAENLRTHADVARASRELIRLRRDVPVAISWEAARTRPCDPAALAAFFREMGFRSLTDRALALAPREGVRSTEPPRPAAVSAPTIAADEAVRPLAAGDVAAFARRLVRQGRVSIAVARRGGVDADRSKGPEARRPDGLAVAAAGTEGPDAAAFVSIEDATGPAGEPLRRLMGDPAVEILGHDLKYQMVALAAAGIELAGCRFDTLLADYLLESGDRDHALVTIARRLAPETLAGQAASPDLDRPASAAEAVRAAEAAAQVAGPLAEALERESLGPLFRDLEMPLVRLLSEMEREGIGIDVPLLERLSTRYAERLATLEAEIHALAGRPFTILSPLQLRGVLFEDLGLPVVKRTKTGPSTDVEVLEELAPLHPLPAKLIEHRQFSKLKSTYVDALPRLVDPASGRVHTSFNQTVTATGRLSSSDPNLQNIPIRSREGREIRAAFVARPDWRFVSADYSQIELRVLAHLSRDAAMLEAFAAGRDIHTATAMAVFGLPADAIDSDRRRVAKAVNFGILYGQSGFGLAKALSITPLEANAFRTVYFQSFAGAAAFMDDCLDRCRRDGFVTTLLGRRRRIDGVRPRDRRRDASGNFALTLPERTAINTVVQGSAADLIKRAMLAVWHGLGEQGLSARIVLQIHDELLLESPEPEVERVRLLSADRMRGAIELAVPLEVTLADGRTWAECDKAG
jgi:DNA polymerase-1